ncbi:MAG TPA: PH domain-containing protein, partial [Pirellulales bacterium]|nr:PH domain-containing protein [Pirellulales bacterium]
MGPSEKGAGKAPHASAPVSTQAGAAEPAAINPGPALAGRRRQDVPEETLWEGRYSPKAALGPLVGCALASIAVVVIAAVLGSGRVAWTVALVVVVAVWLAALGLVARKRLGIRYKLTNQMFYHQRGILTRTTDRIEVIDIDDITYTQGLFERLVNVGRIEVLSSDRTNPKFCVEGVENVEEVAKTMDRARRAERIRRGVSVDSLAPGA